MQELDVNIARCKLKILSKNYWNLQDIAEYFDINRNEACATRKLAIVQYDGLNEMCKSKTKASAIMSVHDTTLKEEIYKWERILNICANLEIYMPMK